MISRRDKVVGAVVGVALFAGLFYLIYDSFVSAPAREEYAADNAEELGIETPEENADEEPAAEGETSAEDETPVAAPPAPAPQGK